MTKKFTKKQSKLIAPVSSAALILPLLYAGLAEGQAVAAGLPAGVTGATVAADGSVTLALANGTSLTLAADMVSVGAGGALTFTATALAEIQAAVAAVAAVGIVPIAGAAVGGAVLVAATAQDTPTETKAVIGGDTTGTVVEDAGGTDLITIGALTVKDPDSGQAVFVAQTATAGSYGSFTLGTDGTWSYTASNDQAAIQTLGADQTLTDRFTAVTKDGTTQTVTVTITGTNDMAVISGDTTGAVTEDATNLTAEGSLSVSDVDTGQAVFVAQQAKGEFGDFELGSDGHWTYQADNGLADIQSLGADQTLTERFTAVTADGTTQTVTLTITGVNDAAQIGGGITGAVTEDATSPDLTTGGSLTVTDVDADESEFTAQAATGDYGSFSLASDGTWTYTAENTQEAIQSLGDGETLTDSFDAVTLDGTIQTVTVTIHGTNDVAVITGDTTGAVTEDATSPNLTAGGTLTVSDVDTDQAVFVAQTTRAGSNGYGSFTLGTDGAWTYTADNSQTAIQSLRADQTLTDSFDAVTLDGTTQTVTVTINGTNDVAVISGTATGDVTEDESETGGNLITSGTLTVSDVDTGQAVFVAQTTTATYGNFTLASDGTWTYTADNSQDAIQSLGDGQTLTDSFTAKSADGTEQVVTVTLHGVNATIGGTATGTLTEDVDVNSSNQIIATGKLDISDPTVEFVALTNAADQRGYGYFDVTANGDWTYTIANNVSQVQNLLPGSEYIGSLTVWTTEDVSQVISVTIHGADDAAVIDGDTTGSVTEDVTQTSGVLTVFDADADQSEFVAQTANGDYGTFTLDADGAWDFSANATLTAIQSLGDGATLTDSFTVASLDGTTQEVQITITGTNDVAVISGTTAGEVTEDETSPNLTTGGALTVTDTDAGEAVFVAQTVTAHYGSFTLAADGTWTYTASNAQSAIQSLGDGQSLTDSFTAATADGTTQKVSVTIYGMNDAAVIAGDLTGAVSEDASTPDLTTSGTLTVTDVDSDQAVFVAQTATGGYGTFTLGTDGAWTYAALNSQAAIQALGQGVSLTDSFAAETIDGTTQVVTVTLTGTNDAAVISGISTGSVTEDAASTDLTTGGSLAVADVDTDQAVFVAQTVARSYGTFTLGTDGAWTYTANNAQSAIQSLGAGQTLTDSFTAASADGTTQTVTVTINGTNDVAVIGGTATGAVTEDVSVTSGNLTTSGSLTVTDVDAGQAVFVAQASTVGSNGYGTFTLGTGGGWSYTASNAQSAIQGLLTGQSLTDSFTAATADGTTQVVTVTINGTSDTAVIGGTSTGAVTEDTALTSGNLTTSGTLTVTDPDAGQAVFVAQTATATYGTFTLGTNGAWSYSADNSQSVIQSLGAGQTLTDSFTAATADGTTLTVTVTINGRNDAAVIGGDTGGAVTEDATAPNLTTSGSLTVTDVDTDQGVFVAQTVTRSYGTFTMGTDGAWSYSANNAQSAIQSLGAGNTLTDSFTAATLDGTTQTVTVTINGTNDAAVIGGTATGAVTEDVSVTGGNLTTSGSLTVTDVDAGEAVFGAKTVAGSNGYGSFTLATNGAWTYSADNSQSAIQRMLTGQTLNDSFTAATADGARQTVTVTINGASDTAVIGGTATGSVTEDVSVTGGYLNTSGTLTVTDPDANQAVFVLQSVTRSYGIFTLDTNGAWTYAANNSQSAIQGLLTGQTLTDSFTAATADGTTRVVTVTINGTSDTAVIGGTSTGSVTEDVSVTGGYLNTSGTLTVTDPDAGQAVFVAQTVTRSYGIFTLATNGAWTYTASNAHPSIQGLLTGGTLTDSFTAATADGTTQAVTVTINGTSDTAVIGGVSTGSVTEDVSVTSGKLTASGSLTVTDPDAGQAVFVAQTNTAGSYGAFTLGTNGSWSYSALNSQSAIQNLNTGQSVTDSFTAVTADGTSRTVTVTINGVDDTTIQLSAIEAGRGGFVINGVSANDQSGWSVSNAGDVNGDGLDDLIVGAKGDDPFNRSYSGASFVVFGKTSGTAVQLSTIEAGTGGFVINGASAYDFSGGSVSAAGDVNGDGLDDLIVGAYGVNNNTGASYVVFGKTSTTAVQLGTVAAGTGGFVINGVSFSDLAGLSVSTAGDVNGDGLDDLIVGAYRDDPNGTDSGASFVVFGKTSGTAVQLSAVEAGTGGFVIRGVSGYDKSGRSVSNAGDVNGDGLDDLIVGAHYDDPRGSNSGASFVVFGKTSGSIVQLSTIEAGAGGGFAIYGVSANDYSGGSVSNAGDVNGDGLDDLIVGAYGDDPNGGNSGASFVVFGKTSGTAVQLSAIEAGTGGFVINGISASDASGRSVSTAGDVNGDGLDDLIVGAYRDDPNGADSGASFVVFGKTSGTAVQLSALEAGIGGFAINGVSMNDNSGRSVSAAGDVNGDGFDDLIIGAWGDDPNGTDSGESFVVFGADFSKLATQIGTLGADTLTGTAAANYLIAGAGNDLVIGGGGADVLRGGAGDDVLAVSDLNFAQISGGNGTDTLRLDGTGQTLDLAVIDNTSLDGIERIDLGQGNTLTLNRIEVLRLSDVTNTVRVYGDVTDRVIVNEPGWVSGSAVTDGGQTFDVYTNGNARIEIAQAVLRTTPIAAIQLSAVEAGTGGFVMNGVSANDQSGRSVSNAGDVNGDGLDDLIIGASQDAPNGANSGESFVVFGKSTGGMVQLTSIENGIGGFAIYGASGNDFSGYSVSTAGDVNGDGLMDLIIGAPVAAPLGRTDSGATYVVFGKTTTTAVQLSAVGNGNGGFVINGAPGGGRAGTQVNSAGDVNGDGLADLVTGARNAGPNGVASGASYVIFGKTDGTVVDLTAVQNGTGGFAVYGVSAYDSAGRTSSNAGDVNGDGLDDLIFGAANRDVASTNNNTNTGASYVVFGKTNGTTVQLSALEAGAGGGFAIYGVSATDYAGRSVSNAGDVNGDGLDDMIIGVPNDDPNFTNSGASFVVFGRTASSVVQLSAIEAGIGGFVINGISFEDQSGTSVSNAGDLNGDGLDDLLIGTPFRDTNGVTDTGSAYVVFGKTSGAAVQLTTIEAGIGGFVMNGISAYDRAGFSVSAAGDVNGDGFDDLIIGAFLDDPNGTSSGASFLVFGGNFSGVATKIGTVGADTLTGTAVADNLIAGTGNDVVVGGGGADVLRGGAGDDVLAISDLNFSQIAGGTGTDTLRFDGTGQTLNLTTFDNTSLEGIERIDLGAGNSLTLNKIEVQRLSDSTNTLRILGNATDSVTLTDSGWVSGASITADGQSYAVYTNGNARLEVDQDVIRTGFPAPTIPAVQLSAIELGNGGFAINGVINIDLAGRSVSNAGDVNGDGLDDLIVGADGADPNGNQTGASYVVFGKINGTVVQLSNLGSGGFAINGEANFDLSGYSVSTAGDVNGDGLDDLIVGAFGADPNGNNSGASYVVFGKTGTIAVQLSTVAAGTGGFVIKGVSAEDYSGRSVSNAGDVNGDGLDDLIIGARGDDPNGIDSGASFVVFGKTSGSVVQLSAIEAGIGGFVINGVSGYDRSGVSVSAAGDVNGDGLDDLIVGANFDDPHGFFSGASFVVFGKTSGNVVNLSAVEAGSGGFVINGVSGYDRSGFAVSGAGDVNGDGLDDLIVGANGDDPNGDTSGASFVVFGKTAGTAVELSAVEAGFGGFVINGACGYDRSGYSVSAAGDVNGDGLDDLIIGADFNDRNGINSGASYVVFGKTSGSVVQLSAVTAGTGGFVINGVSEDDNSGRSVSGAGDVNGDGFDDLIIGAIGDDPNGPNSGESFVVFGGDFVGLATQVGTVGADTLTGTAAANSLIAGSGNDVVVGNGGADVLRGGAGDDVLAISDLTFAQIAGGTGTDTLRLDGTGLALNLTTFDNTSLEGIERIDLGAGNSLTLNKIEVQRLSDSTNTLRVMGNATDSVTLTDSGWVSGASITADGQSYAVYTNGTARLEVDQDVIRTGFPAPPLPAVQLSAIAAGTGGFVINAAAAYDFAGRSVSNAGDVNGDGLDDLIIGADGADPNGNLSGASYVVFGKTSGTAVQLSNLGNGGFVINGASAYDKSGLSVSTAGDVNGDGFDDLIVGVRDADPNGLFAAGASYVVFGKNSGTEVQLTAIAAGNNGFVINGVGGFDYSGRSASTAGDVNGDGLDDLIIGARGDSPNGNDSGASFVVFGKTSGSIVQLSAIEAGNGGFVINGVSEDDLSGHSVSNAGDVNGDGLDDLIVGAIGDDPNGTFSGASFVVFGKTSGSVVQLSVIESGLGGFVINGISAGDLLGASVSTAGDVNGDGLDDLIVGAYGANPNGSMSGASYVVFGKTSGSVVQLSTIEAGNGGFVINGVSANDRSGNTVSAAGDVNGDGLDDLIIGASFDDPNGGNSGASFVVFGKTSGSVVQLSTIESGGGGFVINGVSAGDYSGNSVSNAGDVNGDGFADLIVGAPLVDSNGTNSGASYVLFGGNLTGSVAQLGTSGADALTGTAAGDVIFGAMGNDTLDGGGGLDRLSGGEGADRFVIRDLAGTTTVADFTAAIGTAQDDVLDVSAFHFGSFAAFQATLSYTDAGHHDVKVSLDSDTFVILQGIDQSILTVSNVVI